LLRFSHAFGEGSVVCEVELAEEGLSRLQAVQVALVPEDPRLLLELVVGKAPLERQFVDLGVVEEHVVVH